MLFDLDRGLWLLVCRSSSGLLVLLTNELQGSGLLDSSVPAVAAAVAAGTGAA